MSIFDAIIRVLSSVPKGQLTLLLLDLSRALGVNIPDGLIPNSPFLCAADFFVKIVTLFTLVRNYALLWVLRTLPKKTLSPLRNANPICSHSRKIAGFETKKLSNLVVTEQVTGLREGA